MKSDRSKATDIPKAVKDEVWERDGGKCILCGTRMAMPNAHYIPRSAGGLGIARNIVTLCMQCHFNLDQTTRRKILLVKAKEYLVSCYKDWNEEELKYKKRR